MYLAFPYNTTMNVNLHAVRIVKFYKYTSYTRIRVYSTTHTKYTRLL